MDAIISIRNLEKSYGALRAVRGVSLDVPRGGIVGLIGPDGAGKTTLLRIVVTLLRPDAGEVRVNGLRADREASAIRGITGYMPQRFSLYPDLSVDQNIRFFADLFTVPRRDLGERMRRLYAFTRLEPFAGRLAGRLSGGMKQKLALSCTLIHDPVVLVLDEPTTGVDPVSRNEFWSLLRELRDGGVSILVSTPYMDEASHCDRIAVMHGGRILAEDAPDAFPALMRGAVYRVRGSGQRPAVGQASLAQPAAVDALAALPGVASAHNFGDSVHVTALPDAEERALTAAIRAALPSGSDVQRIAPSIEDVFISLIGGAAHDDA